MSVQRIINGKVLGWDAAGVVEAIGDQVSQFKVGDLVWYAGALNRQGSNSELQLVDERIVGHKPKSLEPTEAAALPLTAITAWEMLFDRLQVPKGCPRKYFNFSHWRCWRSRFNYDSTS